MKFLLCDMKLGEVVEHGWCWFNLRGRWVVKNFVLDCKESKRKRCKSDKNHGLWHEKGESGSDVGVAENDIYVYSVDLFCIL